MNQDFKTLNILLTVFLIIFITPWVLVPYRIISVPESMVNPVLGIAVVCGGLFYFVLARLASKKHRSVIKWVGLPIIFTLFGGPVVAYIMMLIVKPLEKTK